MDDIKNYITYMLNDVMTLIHFCSTDKKARQLCRKQLFWKRQFKQFGLPLDVVNYTTSGDWIQLFLKTNDLWTQLKQLHNEKSITLNTNITKLNLFNIFNVNIKGRNNHLLLINKIKLEAVGDCSIIISYYNFKCIHELNPNGLIGHICIKIKLEEMLFKLLKI
jgi:hypothetical protein